VLLEPLRQLQRGQVGPIVSRAARRQPEGPAQGGVAAGLLGALPGETLLLGALGRVAALGLLALRRLLLAPPGATQAGHARHPGHATTAAQLAHRLLRGLEALEELVDLRDGHPRTAGDAGAPGTVDLLGVGPLPGGHRPDHRLDAVELPLVESV